MKRWLPLVAPLVAFVLLFTACGDDSEDEDREFSEQNEPRETTTTTTLTPFDSRTDFNDGAGGNGPFGDGIIVETFTLPDLPGYVCVIFRDGVGEAGYQLDAGCYPVIRGVG